MIWRFAIWQTPQRLVILRTLMVGFCPPSTPAKAGKAIGVLVLVAQISGSNGAYPLAVLPKIISDISPFLPATHSIVALRAAIAGIYNNDYWHALGSLLLFLIPLLLIGLVLRIPLVKFNKWYVAKVESTKVIS